MNLKTLSTLLLFITIFYLSCKKESSAEINSANKSKFGTYSWFLDFTGTSDDAALLKKISLSGVNNVFMTISENLLLPAGSSKQDAYTNKFKKMLDSLEKHQIKVHPLILNDPEFTFDYMHQTAINQIEVFNSFCKDNPQYLGHPIVGINIDVEPHATPDWQNSTNWGAKEYIMEQFIGLLRDIRPHTTITTHAGQYTFILSAAIAGWFDDVSLQGKLPSGNIDTLRKYIDLLVPMIYFDGTERTYPLDTKISLMKVRPKNEVDNANTVIGINMADYQDINEIHTLENATNAYYGNNTTYQGICYFAFKDYCDKAGIK